MQLDGLDRTWLVVDLDLFIGWNELNILDAFLVLLTIIVALGRVLVVIEGHARADDIQYGGALIAHRGLDQLAHLLGVAGERASDEAAVGYERLHTDVDRRQFIQA